MLAAKVRKKLIFPVFSAAAKARFGETVKMAPVTSSAKRTFVKGNLLGAA